jgi:hypothetical protein
MQMGPDGCADVKACVRPAVKLERHCRDLLIKNLGIAGGSGLNGAQHLAQAVERCALYAGWRLAFQHHGLRAMSSSFRAYGLPHLPGWCFRRLGGSLHRDLLTLPWRAAHQEIWDDTLQAGVIITHGGGSAEQRYRTRLQACKPSKLRFHVLLSPKAVNMSMLAMFAGNPCACAGIMAMEPYLGFLQLCPPDERAQKHCNKCHATGWVSCSIHGVLHARHAHLLGTLQTTMQPHSAELGRNVGMHFRACLHCSSDG